MSTEPASINLSDILQIKRQLASLRAKDDVAWSLVKNIVCPESDAANDDISSFPSLIGCDRTIFSFLFSQYLKIKSQKDHSKYVQPKLNYIRYICV